MAAIGKVSIELEAKVAKLESDLKKAATSLEREMSKMRHASSKAMAEISTTSARTAKAVESHSALISKSLRTAFNVTAVAGVVKALTHIADEYANISARVRLAAGSNANFEKSMASVLKVSMSTYASLDATARLTQKISQGLQSTGVSARDAFSKAIELTEVFNKGLVVSGAATIQAQSAMLQFSQAIAKGKLDGDEFRSVMENNSAFMALFAKSLGVSTGELYKMREEGKLTTDMLYKVLGNTKELEEQFKSFPVTVTRAFENLKSSITVFLGQANEAVGITRAFAAAIGFLAENLSAIATVVGSAAAVYALSKAFAALAAVAKTVQVNFVAHSQAIVENARRNMEAAKAVAMHSEALKDNAIFNRNAIAATMQATNAAKADVAQRIAASKQTIDALKREQMSTAQVAAARKALAASSSTYFSPATNRIIQESTTALQRNAVVTTQLAVAQKTLAAQQASFSALMKNGSAQSVAMAGAMSQVVLANSNLAKATTSSIAAQNALAAASRTTMGALAGLGAALGGWPTLIAAAVVATYLLVDAFINAKSAAEQFDDSLVRIADLQDKTIEISVDLAFGDVDSSRIDAALNGTRAEADSLQQQIFNLKEEIGALEQSYVPLSLKSAMLSDKTALLAEMQRKLNGLISTAIGLSGDFATAREREARIAAVAASTGDFEKEVREEIERLKDEKAALGKSREELVAYTLQKRIAAAETKKGAALTEAEIARFKKIGEELRVQTRETEQAVIADEARIKSLKEGEKAAKKNAEEQKRLAEAVRENSRASLELAAEGLGPLEESYQQMLNAQEEWRDKLEEGETTAEDAARAIEALAEKHKKNAEEIKREAEAQAYANDIMGRTQERYAEEAGAVGLAARAAYIYAEVMEQVAEAREKVRRGETVNFNREEAEAAAAAHYDLMYALEQSAELAARWEANWVDAGHAAADVFAEFFVDVISLSGSFEDAWEDLGDALVDIIKQSVAQMISEFFKLQIINPMLNSIFQGFGGAVLPTQGGGWMNSIMSLFGGGGGGSGGGFMNSIMSMFGMGGSTGLINTGLAPIFGSSTLLGGATTTATSGLSGLGGTTGSWAGGGFSMSTVMSAIPWAALIAAGISRNNRAYDTGWRTNGGTTALPNGQSVSGGGSPSWMGGRLSDNLLQALGFSSRTASMLSGSALHTRIFGRSMPQLRSGNTGINFGDGSTSQSYRTVERGGVFRSDRWRTTTGPLTDEAADAAEEMIASVAQTIREAAQAMGGQASETLQASLRIVQEFDSKGKVKATKFFVDALGRTWEEATEEAAATRIHAEAIIATIDSILGTTSDAAIDAIEGGTEAVFDEAGNLVSQGVAGVADDIIKATGKLGEASAIAERWRDDADMLMEGAQFLLLAASDIRDGVGLLGESGTLTQITELIEELQNEGETLSDTYMRVAQSAALYRDALELQGMALNNYGEDFVRFATEITEAAGGIERATSLWQTYFDTFFTAGERAQLALSRARTSAGGEFEDIGLNVSDFTGDGGLARFRAAFEAAQRMGDLSAEAMVEWLEAGEALARLTAAQNAYNQTLVETEGTVTALTASSGGLAAFMQGIEASISNFGNEGPDFGSMFADLNEEFALIIKDAIAMGASEEDLGRIRELYMLRYNDILEQQRMALEAQAQAAQDLANTILELNVMAQNGGSLPSYLQTLTQIRNEYDNQVQNLHDLARAAGRAGASEEELAAASNWMAAAIAAAAAALIRTGQDLVQQLYGGGVGGSSGGDINPFYGPENTGINEINAAVEDRYARELALLEQLRDYVDSLNLSSLSPLTPEERLLEAQAQYEDLLARAMAGDLEAMAQLQQAANTYLGEAQSYYGGVGAYGNIFDQVREALMGLVDRGPLNEPPESGPTEITGVGGGGVLVEPGDGFNEQAEQQRMALAQELATVMRDIMMLTGDSLLEVADQLGLDLRDLVRDLGADLDELTVETTLALVDIADMLGVSLQTLADSVGFQLGELADQNSLISQALAQTINTLPSGIASTLNSHLAAIRNATTAAGYMGATEEMTAYMNTLPADIRDELDEFFPDVLTDEEIMRANVASTAANTLLIKAAAEATKVATEATASGVFSSYNRLQDILNQAAFQTQIQLGMLAALEGELPDPPPPPVPDVTFQEEDDAEDDGMWILAQEIKILKQAVLSGFGTATSATKENTEVNRQIVRKLETTGPRGNK